MKKKTGMAHFYKNIRIKVVSNAIKFSLIGSASGREPWSSGYGRRLTFLRSWVRIPVPYTGWTFFHIKLLLNCVDVCLKKTENKRKRGRGWPIFLIGSAQAFRVLNSFWASFSLFSFFLNTFD